MTVGRVHAAHAVDPPVCGDPGVRARGRGGGRLAVLGRADHELGRRLPGPRASTPSSVAISFLGSTRVVVVVTLVAAALTLAAMPPAGDRDPHRGASPAARRGGPEGARGPRPARRRPPRPRPRATRSRAVTRWPPPPAGACSRWSSALYTRRRVLWWAVAIGVWTLAVLVGRRAASGSGSTGPPTWSPVSPSPCSGSRWSSGSSSPPIAAAPRRWRTRRRAPTTASAFLPDRS